MSDEEKKAIEKLKWYFEESTGLDIEKQTRTVLNLIEKQQKEIEELKEKNKKYTIHFTDKQYSDAIKLAQSVAISMFEDKIKAIIEELKLIADNGANAVRFAMTHDDEVERIQKQKDISAMIDILQSLLEKE